MKKLVVVSPCYNETRFVEAWLTNCARFADRVIVSDGGSTDGTTEVFKNWQLRRPGWITVLRHPQSPNPQRDLWAEHDRRQALVDEAGTDADTWIVALDVDEMIADDFRALADNALDRAHKFGVLKYHFWRSPKWYRVDTPEDPAWQPGWAPRIFPAGALAIGPEENHTENLCSLPMLKIPGCILYHYHYLFAESKVFENRPRYQFGLDPHEVRLRNTDMPHPAALSLVTDCVNFGHLARIRFR